MVGWSSVGLKFSLHMVNIRHKYYENHIIIGHAQHTLTKSSELNFMHIIQEYVTK